MTGRFVVLEGIDGSGTTTQAHRLSHALRERGVEVVLTREPTEGAVGTQIRAALQHRLELGSGERVTLPPECLALLFAADRLDHLARVVEPALARGSVVVSDRYVLSSLVYQSATDAEGERALPWLRAINERARRPDLTVVLDVPADVAEERRRQRGGPPELFEQTRLQRRLAELYARAEELLPGDPVAHVPGEAPEDVVAARLLDLVVARMGALHAR